MDAVITGVLILVFLRVLFCLACPPQLQRAIEFCEEAQRFDESCQHEGGES